MLYLTKEIEVYKLKPHKMKQLLFITLFTISSISIFAQNQDKEQRILELEKEWTNVLEKNDTIALKKYWTDDYVVNNATGKVVTSRQILDLMKSGHVFPKVERHVEKVTFNGDLAIVMGSEIEFGKDNQQKNRRFTNIWRETSGGWKLVARQANGN